MLSALTTCSVSLWSRFVRVLEEPDTAYDSRPEVNADALEAWGEIRTTFPFVSTQNGGAPLHTHTHSGIWSSLMLFTTEHSLSVVVSAVMCSASWSLDIFRPRTIHPPG